MSIAFFDLDETVIDFNSGGAWLKSELVNGHISIRQFLRGAWGLARYRLGAADIEPLLKDGVAAMAGEAETAFRDRCRDFYLDRVRGRWRPGALAALNASEERGEPRVLLTTASIYLAEEVCNELALDAALATTFEVGPDGRFTGFLDGPLSFGEGKVRLAEAFADARGVQLSECSFFTDSYSDYPMLKAVGNPVAVHPDRRLRALAQTRGWPIEMW